MHIQEELSLVARGRQGDRAAMGLLWDAITPKLYGYLINTLRDAVLAEDILQETWTKALNALPKFRPQGVRFSAWLFAIARNECRQHWRRGHHEIEPLSEETDLRATYDPESIQERLLIESVLQRLSEADREILRLRYLADLEYKEIARVLQISTISARVRVSRALGRARTIINIKQPSL